MRKQFFGTSEIDVLSKFKPFKLLELLLYKNDTVKTIIKVFVITRIVKINVWQYANLYIYSVNVE